MRRRTIVRAPAKLRELSPVTPRKFVAPLPAISRKPVDHLKHKPAPAFLALRKHTQTPHTLRKRALSSTTSSRHSFTSSNSSKRGQVNRRKHAVAPIASQKDTPEIPQAYRKLKRKHPANQHKTVSRKPTTVRATENGVTREHEKGNKRKRRPLITRRNTVVRTRKHVPAVAVTRKHAKIKASKHTPVISLTRKHSEIKTSKHVPVIAVTRRQTELTEGKHALVQTTILSRTRLPVPTRGNIRKHGYPRTAPRTFGSSDGLLGRHASSTDTSSKYGPALNKLGKLVPPRHLRKLDPTKMSSYKYASAPGTTNSKTNAHNKPAIKHEKTGIHDSVSESTGRRVFALSTSRKHVPTRTRTPPNSRIGTHSHSKTRPKESQARTPESQTSAQSEPGTEIPEQCNLPDVYTRLFRRSKSRMQKEEQDVYTTAEEHTTVSRPSDPHVRPHHSQSHNYGRPEGQSKARSRPQWASEARPQRASDARPHGLPGVTPRKARQKGAQARVNGSSGEKRNGGLEVHSAFYNHRVYAHMKPLERL